MNASITTGNNGARGLFPRARMGSRIIELWVFTLALALLNWPLFCGGTTDLFAFVPAAIGSGQWWRAITHPFVHVSWYHFLLDAAAFLILYHGLLAGKSWQRLGCVAASAGVSLLVALAVSPELIASQGFRGLSGVDHGLMIFSMLEILKQWGGDPQMRRLGFVGGGAVLAKVLWEMYSGTALFGALHLGLLGMPVVACHAGGVLGALFFWLGSSIRKRPPLGRMSYRAVAVL